MVVVRFLWCMALTVRYVTQNIQKKFMIFLVGIQLIVARCSHSKVLVSEMNRNAGQQIN